MAGHLFTDTTEFFNIDFGDIIEIGEKHYIVKGHAHERRFGIEDPKFWVKRTVDMETGGKKILKLSFLESFETRFGTRGTRCFRNPRKEADILELVKGHPYFMQGTAQKDEKGNIIRILDIVPGQNFLLYIDSLRMGHRTYFHTALPGIMKKLVKAFEAIRFLHIHGFKHGDIRNDHIIVERNTGNYVWIDFDYDYDGGENPFEMELFGLGNILINAVGKGFHTVQMILSNTRVYGDLKDHLEPMDFSVILKRRFVNLRKLYPYIPKILNDILMHFSRDADVYYKTVDDLVEEIKRYLRTVS